MADTSWEESQKNNPRFRWLLWLLIVLSVASVAGIIIYNNREYFSGISSTGSKHGSREVFSPGTVHGPGRQSAADVKNAPDPSKYGGKGGAATRDSVSIADIACRVMDRDDLLVRLSITLFFSDAGRRPEILARRDIMAVMAQKTLKTMALDDVKIDRIKPLLLKEINAVFENSVFSDISIHAIAVEKVSNE